MIHENFKAFALSFENGKFSTADKKQILKFTDQPEIFAHSVGAQYVNSTGKVVMTIGYTTKKKGKAKKYTLTVKKLGQFQFGLLEAALTKTASKLEKIICHELIVTADDTAYAIFLHEHEVA